MCTPTQTQVRRQRDSIRKDTLEVEETEMPVLASFKKLEDLL